MTELCVAVILPCYNEEAAIVDVIAGSERHCRMQPYMFMIMTPVIVRLKWQPKLAQSYGPIFGAVRAM